jgi:hypothetical protein
MPTIDRAGAELLAARLTEPGPYPDGQPRAAIDDDGCLVIRQPFSPPWYPHHYIPRWIWPDASGHYTILADDLA